MSTISRPITGQKLHEVRVRAGVSQSAMARCLSMTWKEVALLESLPEIDPPPGHRTWLAVRAYEALVAFFDAGSEYRRG